jgi:hypothetical protein
VFVIMAVYAQVFPVRSVRGIVVAVPVLVVYGQQVPVLVVELPSAFGADQAVDLEGPFTVVRGPGPLFQFLHDIRG